MNVTCGSGGVVVTNSGRLARAIAGEWHRFERPTRLAILRDFVAVVLLAIFIRPWLYWIPAALPFLSLIFP